MKNRVDYPLISIIMPVYKVKINFLKAAIRSIQNQEYENWQLCVVDDCSKNTKITDYLKSLAISDKRIKVKLLRKNTGIAIASNHAIAMASGDFIALMDHDDILTKDALHECAKVICNNKTVDFIYSDTDKIDEKGKLCEPFFKPDFSPDYFLSANYLNHLTVIRTSILKDVGGFRNNTDGSQDYDLYLRIQEKTTSFFHIPKILYHWRKAPGSVAENSNNKPLAYERAQNAIQEAMRRRNISAEVFQTQHRGIYRVKYTINENPLLSIIIPFRDKPNILKTCLKSILKKSTYWNYEILLVNNNSKRKETYMYLKTLKDKRIRIIKYMKNFNFSAINNYAVKQAKGSILLFLNNDTEVISSDWIESMLEHAQRDNVGAVGAKLLFPNGSIQHCGVVLGIGGVAGHVYTHYPGNYSGYFGCIDSVKNYSALTGACLMTQKKKFQEVGGFDETLAVTFNDIDFCLKLKKKGYFNVYTPYSVLYHHESKSRGRDNTLQKVIRFNHEVEIMKRRWKELLHDPYYNPNLTMHGVDFSIGEQSQYFSIYKDQHILAKTRPLFYRFKNCLKTKGLCYTSKKVCEKCWKYSKRKFFKWQ